MIEAIKTIKSAPMGTNFKDVTKSALYMIASLVVFTVKLTVVIIQRVYKACKALAGK